MELKQAMHSLDEQLEDFKEDFIIKNEEIIKN